MAKTVKKTTTKKAAKKKVAKKTVKKSAVKKTATKKPAVKKTAQKAISKKTAANKTVKKKTVAQKAPSKKARKKIKSSLTPKELALFMDILLRKRRELIGDVNQIENEALKKSRLDSSGDLSSMPIHMADMGTDNFEQEFSLNLMDGERKTLIEINLALDRIVAGKYGLCEGTGKEISNARLEARPWAKYCIEYATMVEKGLVTEGDRLLGDDDDDDDDLDNDDYLNDDDDSASEYELTDFNDIDNDDDY